VAASPGPASSSSRELRHVRSYVDLEQARRLGARSDRRRRAGSARRSPALAPRAAAVENAVKHGKTDRPLHVLGRTRAPRKLRVTVRDNGRGIAREAIDRARAGVGEGTGLGLASVNLRLTAHYGEGVRLRSSRSAPSCGLEVPNDPGVDHRR
jgi:LytS/YehU family sensor histidine kinase